MTFLVKRVMDNTSNAKGPFTVVYGHKGLYDTDQTQFSVFADAKHWSDDNSNLRFCYIQNVEGRTVHTK